MFNIQDDIRRKGTISEIISRLISLEKDVRGILSRPVATGKFSNILGGNVYGSLVPAAGNRYIVPFYGSIGVSALISTIIPIGGTLKSLMVVTASAQPGSGSLVFEIIMGDAAGVMNINTGIIATVPAGSAAGEYSDFVNTYAFIAQRRIHIKVTNNAAGLSATLHSAVFILES